MAPGTRSNDGVDTSPNARPIDMGLAVDMCLLQWIRIRFTRPHETYQPQCTVTTKVPSGIMAYAVDISVDQGIASSERLPTSASSRRLLSKAGMFPDWSRLSDEAGFLKYVMDEAKLCLA